MTRFSSIVEASKLPVIDGVKLDTNKYSIIGPDTGKGDLVYVIAGCIRSWGAQNIKKLKIGSSLYFFDHDYSGGKAFFIVRKETEKVIDGYVSRYVGRRTGGGVSYEKMAQLGKFIINSKYKSNMERDNLDLNSDVDTVLVDNSYDILVTRDGTLFFNKEALADFDDLKKFYFGKMDIAKSNLLSPIAASIGGVVKMTADKGILLSSSKDGTTKATIRKLEDKWVVTKITFSDGIPVDSSKAALIKGLLGN